jgi:beta-phosphoglucomutase
LDGGEFETGVRVIGVTRGSSPLPDGLALIFDMDGVLIHSNPLHREAWIVFNRRYGLETTEEMHQFMYGKRNDAIVRGFFGADLEPAEVAYRSAAKDAVYREMMAGAIEDWLVPGIRQFLDDFSGVPKALASNAEPETVAFLLDRANLRHHFSVVVDGSQVVNPKPHPEVYLRASDLLEIDPTNCIVFEDSYLGVESALSAGMRVIGLYTTHGSLPGTTLGVDNFLSGDLRTWLGLQSRVTS